MGYVSGNAWDRTAPHGTARPPRHRTARGLNGTAIDSHNTEPTQRPHWTTTDCPWDRAGPQWIAMGKPLDRHGTATGPWDSQDTATGQRNSKNIKKYKKYQKIPKIPKNTKNT